MITGFAADRHIRWKNIVFQLKLVTQFYSADQIHGRIADVQGIFAKLPLPKGDGGGRHQEFALQIHIAGGPVDHQIDVSKGRTLAVRLDHQFAVHLAVEHGVRMAAEDDIHGIIGASGEFGDRSLDYARILVSRAALVRQDDEDLCHRSNKQVL